MSTITKERIELFIKSPLENGLTRGEQMELARIALASLEAELVAWKATFTKLTMNIIRSPLCILTKQKPNGGCDCIKSVIFGQI